MTDTRIPDMGRETERLLQALPRIRAPHHLCEQVVRAVHRERMRMRVERIRLGISSLSGVVSGIGIFFAGRALFTATVDSGFWSYASLLFSDSSIVFGHLNLFLLSLAESLPGVEVVSTLALVTLLLISVRTFLTAMNRVWVPRIFTFS